MAAPPRKQQTATEPEDAASEVAVEYPEGYEQYELLEYTGRPQVIAPFGELSDGEIVAAPQGIKASLLATGWFKPLDGPKPDQEAIRHP